MRQPLVRAENDSRDRECGNGSPACHYAPAHGDNPLGLCVGHLAEHRARCGIPAPAECPACNPIAVYAVGRYVTIVGAMCFSCNRTNGGTVPSEEHRTDAAREMRARLLTLWREGDRGPEWAALLARCPAPMREAFERRLAALEKTS